jgi:diguanylate cyclase (GGDEF)-like protein
MKQHLRALFSKPVQLYVMGMLLIAGGYTAVVLSGAFILPDPWLWILGVLALLLVWQCGLRMPYLGMISMERLVQFHLLLTLPLAETLLITTVATLIMPFINKAYRMNSYRVATLRAANNLAMNAIMLISGYLILQAGLSLPLTGVDWVAAAWIALAAVVMQVINIGMIFLYFTVDKKKISRLFTPAYLFADFVFVPVGVLSALLMHQGDPALFYLFGFFMVVLLVSFYGLNNRKPAEESGSLYQGTEFPVSYLNVEHVTTAIRSRCDQLFDCQAVFLVELDQTADQPRFYLQHNATQLPDLVDFAARYVTQNAAEHGSQMVQGHVVHFMAARFNDHKGVFAQIMLVRVNQVPYTHADLNLLRLFVQRYRAGLSYAITFEKLSEYKDNLEDKVSQRTRQLEAVNREKSQLVSELKKISNSDALTGLYNRRYFDALIKYHQKHCPPLLSLAVIDIDHFKSINDSHGHECGDEVLKTIAGIMRSWACDDTTLVRYGGEEFAAVIHKLSAEDVQDKLQQLLTAVSHHGWPMLPDGQGMTVSIGWSHHPQQPLNKLFELADKALYQAKANGRNQVQPARPLSPDQA